jgi:DMSO/TMAO reductase YedYZ molybdopterin-dependent catalytic subunit
MPQYSYSLPIACVEGWSTTQHWTGVRLSDLGRLVGASAEDAVLTVHSVQPHGPFRHASFAPSQWTASRALLALGVNGAPLSPDHGHPARIIVPAVPGVHNTKWVGRMEFSA